MSSALSSVILRMECFTIYIQWSRNLFRPNNFKFIPLYILLNHIYFRHKISACINVIVIIYSDEVICDIVMANY